MYSEVGWSKRIADVCVGPPRKQESHMHMVKLPLVLTAMVASVISVSGQVAAPPPAAPRDAAQEKAAPLVVDQTLPVDAAVRTGRFANGMRYYIRQNGRPDNRVSLRLAVNVGSIQEDNDQRGLAHFLEHMAFNGTTSFKPGELVSFLESIGARFGAHVNAQTSFDETIYMLDVPTDREGYFEKGLVALHDFGAGMLLTQEEIDKERGVVIEEWRGRLGAGSRLTDKQLPVLLKGSRYVERLPIGTPEILKSFPRQRLVDFYKKWYRPDVMAVVVVGDVDPGEALKLLEKHFASIPAATGTPSAVNRAVPTPNATDYLVSTDPEAQQSTVTLAYKRPFEIQTTVGGYRRSLVDQLVAQMLNLRLREVARRPNAPILGAEAGGGGIVRELTLFEVGAAVPEGGLANGLDALVLETRRVEKFGFAPDELTRAKAALLANFERAAKERETAESPSYANEYVRAFVESEPIPGIQFEYQIASTFVPGVTADEVNAAARRLMGGGSRVVLGVAPEKKDAPVPTDQALQQVVAKADAAPIEAWTDALAGRALVETPPTPGKVANRRTIADLGVTVLSLSNGAEVWLKPTDFKNDQVLLSSYALGGEATAAEADYREAQLVPSLVGVGGMGGLDPVDLSKLLSGKLAQVSPGVDAYTEGTNGQASPRDLETALQLNYLAFTAPNLTEEAFGLMKRRVIGILQNQAQNPRAVFNERVDLINTSNHYTAKAPTPADIEALDLATMRKFYAARFSNAADFTFFLVGTFEVDKITPLIEQWIGGLPSTGKRTATLREMGVKFPTGVVTEEVRKGREPSSQTVMSFFADTNLDELAMHRARAAASVLGIRLRDILREELGGTYGVGVTYENTLPLRGYGAMTVQFGSSPENVEKLTKAVLTEVQRLIAQGPSADDVQKVQELERRDLETATRQNQYWLGSLQTTHLLGWDPAGILRRGDRIEKLSPGVLHEAFKQYFPMNRYTVVTLKPETAGQ
jgi:zinc protease